MVVSYCIIDGQDPVIWQRSDLIQSRSVLDRHDRSDWMGSRLIICD